MEFVENLVQFLCLSGGVGVSEDGDRRIVPVQGFEEAVEVRVFVVVVEEADWVLNIRVFVVELVAVVFSESGEKPFVPSIGCEWVSAGESYVVKPSSVFCADF